MQPAYDDGRSLYRIEQRIRDLKSDLRSAYETLETHPADAPEAVRASRESFFLRAEIQRLQWKYDRLESELRAKYFK